MELARTVGEISLAALDRGDAVILVAQRDHLDAAEEWVRLSGSRSTPAGSTPTDGRYQTFDADDVIGDLDPSADPCGTFARLLDAACDAVPTDVGIVHIFGDLAGTLWGRGQVGRALEIEGLGERLAMHPTASVLCAYPAGVLGNPQDLASVRHSHSGVIHGAKVPSARVSHPRASGELPTGDPTPGLTDRRADASTRVYPSSIPACRAARHFVRAVVEAAGSGEELADAAELVSSELAANAVRHAHSVFTVRVVCHPDGIRIAVGDEAEPGPTAADRHPRSGREDRPFPVRTARGLGIVSALAADWGIDEDTSGKVVWAELGRRSAA